MPDISVPISYQRCHPDQELKMELFLQITMMTKTTVIQNRNNLKYCSKFYLHYIRIFNISMILVHTRCY